jgi:hypothetical protein
MLQILSGDGGLYMVSDDESGTVRIRKDDESPLLGYLTQKSHLLFVLENAEAVGFQARGIDNLRQGILS